MTGLSALAVHDATSGAMATETKRRRGEGLEARTTPEDRALINRAVAVCSTDLTNFVVTNLRVAARRVMAGRSEFTLDQAAKRVWRRPAGDPP